MIPAGARVIVAVSGGPDSVCLLHVLRELTREGGFTLAGVAHVNHQLRGEESDQDEQFVLALAQSMGLTFHRSTGILGAGNLEQSARRVRREFFSELIKGGLADRIAVGHTLDDQAETVLFRILRGSGTRGLAGILPVTREGLVRPLIGVRRCEVRTYLAERGIPWREDSSNQARHFARNRIRHELLPQLERDWNPKLTESLAHLADVAFEEEQAAAVEVERVGAEFRVEPGAVEFSVAGWAGLDRAFQRRLLRHAVRLAKGDVTGVGFDHYEGLLELATRSGSGRMRLPGLLATRSFEWLRLEAARKVSAREPICVSGPGVYTWPTGKLMIDLGLSSFRHLSKPCDTLRVEFPPEGLELRAWRPGDKYWPSGQTRAWTVKELFQKARVPSWKRASWPILTSKDKILWVKEFGPAEGAEWLVVQEVPEISVNLSMGK